MMACPMDTPWMTLPRRSGRLHHGGIGTGPEERCPQSPGLPSHLMSKVPPVMHLYSADRAEDLVGKLADILQADPLDPMQPEWLAVQSDGGDGIAANFVRAYPGTLRSIVLDAAARRDADVTGAERSDDPWQIDRMVWSLLAVFDDLAAGGGMPEFTKLSDGASRFTRVRAVADLFDRYHLHRPEMIRTWAEPDGTDRGPSDGSGNPIPPRAAWQPRLWRILR